MTLTYSIQNPKGIQNDLTKSLQIAGGIQNLRCSEVSKNSSKKTWDTIGYVWIRMDFGYGLDSIGYVWIYLDTFRYVWICLDTFFKIFRIRLDTQKFWIRLDTNAYVWIRLDMPTRRCECLGKYFGYADFPNFQTFWHWWALPAAFWPPFEWNVDWAQEAL